MLDRRSFCFSLLSLPTLMLAASLRVRGNAHLLVFPAIWDGLRKTRFVLNDSLEHPFYWAAKDASQLSD